MVDNQHKQIKGYRDLSQDEISLMNECKEMAVKVGELCNKLQSEFIKTTENGVTTIDGRWLAIGRTDLQKGFMSIIRAIAKPETF